MLFLFKSPKTVAELAKVCNQPWKLGWWLWYKLQYVPDKTKYGIKEYWQTPEETLRDMSGDCEDYALLAHAVLKKLGYSPFILGVIGEGREGHASCAFFYGKKIRYYLLDNSGLRKSGFFVAELWKTVNKNAKIWRVLSTDNKILEEHVKVNDVWRATKTISTGTDWLQ